MKLKTNFANITENQTNHQKTKKIRFSSLKL